MSSVEQQQQQPAQGTQQLPAGLLTINYAAALVC